MAMPSRKKGRERGMSTRKPVEGCYLCSRGVTRSGGGHAYRAVLFLGSASMVVEVDCPISKEGIDRLNSDVRDAWSEAMRIKREMGESE